MRAGNDEQLDCVHAQLCCIQLLSNNACSWGNAHLDAYSHHVLKVITMAPDNDPTDQHDVATDTWGTRTRTQNETA